jgi:hypothetical protein
MNLEETVLDCMKRFRVAYDTNLGRAVVNTVMNMLLP